MLNIISWSICILVAQYVVSVFVNGLILVPFPNTKMGYIKLTFLPYAMWYWFFKHKKK